jgi:hypothetical protein
MGRDGANIEINEFGRSSRTNCAKSIRNCVSEKVAPERCVPIKLLQRLLHCHKTVIPRGLRKTLLQYVAATAHAVRTGMTRLENKRLQPATAIFNGSGPFALGTATHCQKCA